MNKKKELAKNTVIILIGKLCTQFISFFLLPLYTKLLTTEEYGIIDLITSYVSLCVPLITLQIENAVFRFLVEQRDNEEEKTRIITNAYIVAMVSAIIVFCVFTIINCLIHINIYGYICVLVFVTILSNMQLQVSRGLGDNIGYSIGSVIAGVSTIVFNVIFLVFLKFRVEGMLLSSILANLVCFIVVFTKNKTYKYIKIHEYAKKKRKDLLKYSLPLIPNGIMWWIINVSDRTIISTVLDASANGIYAVSNKFSHLLISFYNIFNISWTESAAMHIKDEDKDSFFSSTINTMFKLFASACLGIMAYLSIIFPYFIDESYSDAYNYIPILLFATLFNVLVGLLSVIYIAKKNTKEIAKTSLISGTINIVLNLLFISKIKLYAASFSTLAAFAVMAIYRYIDVQKYAKITLKKSLIIKLIILSGMCIILYYINNIILNIINCVIITIFAILMNKDFIKGVLKTLKDGINKIKQSKNA